MNITFNDLDINIRSDSSWKPGRPAMMTLKTRSNCRNCRVEFYVEAYLDKWKQLEEIVKLCQEADAYEAYLQEPAISYFWPKRPDGTPVLVGETAVTEHGDGFAINFIIIKSNGFTLGSGHGYGRSYSFGEYVTEASSRQMGKYYSKYEKDPE